MNSVWRFGVIWIACVIFMSAVARGVEPANWLLKGADGKPFFPIGLYGFPQGQSDEAMYQEARDAGFNFLVGREAKKGFLRSFDLPSGPPDPDAATRRGSLLDLTHQAEKKRELLEQLIAQRETTPGLIVWQGPDEPNDFPFGIRPGPTPTGLAAGARVLKDRSRHPLWINFGPTGDDRVPSDFARLRPYLEVPDIVSVDIYPVGGGPDIQQSPFAERGPACVGVFTRNLVGMVSHAGIQRKPVWMVLQAFGWADLARQSKPPETWTGRTPTYEEIRFMSFDAIINGAGGVIFWGLPYLPKEDAKVWPALKRVASELNGLLPILTGDALPADHLIRSSDPSVEVAVRRTGSKTYLLIANTRDVAVETSLGFHGIKVSRLVPFGPGASDVPQAQGLHLKLNPWQTAVFLVEE